MQNSTYDPRCVDDFEKSKIVTAFIGLQGTCPFGQTTNIDYSLTDDVLFTGGEFLAKNSLFGDKFSLQIVHPINGVIYTFVNDFGVTDDSQTKMVKQSVIPAKLPAGLIIRLAYTSTGETDVKLIINLYLFKILE